MPPVDVGIVVLLLLLLVLPLQAYPRPTLSAMLSCVAVVFSNAYFKIGGGPGSEHWGREATPP